MQPTLVESVAAVLSNGHRMDDHDQSPGLTVHIALGPRMDQLSPPSYPDTLILIDSIRRVFAGLVNENSMAMNGINAL